VKKLKLFAVFYKSTFVLGVAVAFSIAVLGIVVFFIASGMVVPSDFSLFFGTTLMSGSSVVALLHKEIAFRNEYTFYHNLGISKLALQSSLILTNCLLGLLCITLSHA